MSATKMEDYMKHYAFAAFAAAGAFAHWALRPLRALKLAYSYVLTGRKFDGPVEWKTI